MSARRESGQYARLAGRWLRSAWQEAPPRVTASPRALIGAIERELRGRRRRRVVRRWAVGGLATAAVATLVLGGASRIERLGAGAADPDALVVVATAAGGPETVVTAGTRLLAPESASLRLASRNGTELTLEPNGSVTVVEVGRTKRFALMRGALLSHVKKLGAGERFVVDTADTEVEVRGTMFRVALTSQAPSCGVRSMTEVSVSEGVVAVTGTSGRALLYPGDQWPPPCPPAARADDLPRPTAGAGAHAPARRPARAAGAVTGFARAAGEPDPRAAAPVSPSVLQAQNDLFLSGMRAKHRGDAGAALRIFDRFIRTYPDGSLVESALVQRMRLLTPRDAWAGHEAAEAYLARFPDGFARTEARQIADDATR